MSKALPLLALVALVSACSKDDAAKPEPSPAAQRSASEPSLSLSAPSAIAAPPASSVAGSTSAVAPSASAVPTASTPASTVALAPASASAAPSATIASSARAPSTKTVTAATAAGGGAPVLTVTPVSVHLIAAGAEPRTPLRYRVAKGLSQSVNVTVSLGPSGTTPQPIMTIGLSSVVTDVTPENLIRADLKIDKLDMPDNGPMGANKAELDKLFKVVMQGRHHLVLSDRGVLKDDKVDGLPAGDPMATQLLEATKQAWGQSLTQLPEEAVGTGAKWESANDMTMSQAGARLKVHNKLTYELVSRQGDTAQLKVALAQTADPPPASGRGPDISSLSITGDGPSTVDLAKLLATSLHLKQRTSIPLKINGQTMSQAMEGGINLVPR